MPSKIEFSIGETYDFDHERVNFGIKVDGQKIACHITEEVLMSKFGAEVNKGLAAFKQNRASIEVLAAQMIEAGKVENGVLSITTDNLRRR